MIEKPSDIKFKKGTYLNSVLNITDIAIVKVTDFIFFATGKIIAMNIP
ncbi:hypothetical protein SDC9_208569 [bioreactor metagenome]|uniref:Uncharacterized protein n=1 Tax=bioreactor metagenome TaxID=1076179 RepID=A0A645JBX9_9ZZZZ